MKLTLVALSYHVRREQFTLPCETYDQWVILGADEGRFEFQIGDGVQAISGQCSMGDWVLCPPGKPLHRRLLTCTSFHFCRFAIEGESPHALIGRNTLRDTARLRANFAALRFYSTGAQGKAWIEHILLDLLRGALWERLIRPICAQPDAAMQQVATRLERELEQKISLEGIASELKLSPVAFTRRFRAATGKAPSEFLLEKRLNSARTLMLETNLTLETIAARSGFSNAFYFSRVWTKTYGIAPSKFRRLHQV